MRRFFNKLATGVMVATMAFTALARKWQIASTLTKF